MSSVAAVTCLCLASVLSGLGLLIRWLSSGSTGNDSVPGARLVANLFFVLLQIMACLLAYAAYLITYG